MDDPRFFPNTTYHSIVAMDPSIPLQFCFEVILHSHSKEFCSHLREMLHWQSLSSTTNVAFWKEICIARNRAALPHRIITLLHRRPLPTKHEHIEAQRCIDSCNWKESVQGISYFFSNWLLLHWTLEPLLHTLNSVSISPAHAQRKTVFS